jgi:hypothetical protein
MVRYFPAASWNCMTHGVVVQGFFDMSWLSFHKSNEVDLFYSCSGRKLESDTFMSIRESTVFF